MSNFEKTIEVSISSSLKMNIKSIKIVKSKDNLNDDSIFLSSSDNSFYDGIPYKNGFYQILQHGEVIYIGAAIIKDLHKSIHDLFKQNSNNAFKDQFISNNQIVYKDFIELFIKKQLEIIIYYTNSKTKYKSLLLTYKYESLLEEFKPFYNQKKIGDCYE